MNRTPLPDLDIVATPAAVVVTPRALGAPVTEPALLTPVREAGMAAVRSEEGQEFSRPVEVVAWVATCWALTCEVRPAESPEGAVG